MKQRVHIGVGGMNCGSCAARVESKLKTLSGVTKANVNFAMHQAAFDMEDSKITLDQVKSEIEKIGYKLIEVGQSVTNIEEEERNLQKFWLSLVGSSILMLLSMHWLPFALSQKTNNWIQFCIALPIWVWAGDRFVKALWISIRQLHANMNTLIGMGTAAAFVYSFFVTAMMTFWPEEFVNLNLSSHVYFETTGFIVAFILLGNYLESRARGKTSQAIQKLMGLQCKEAIKIVDGQQVLVPIHKVEVGDRLLVKPGEKVGLDGVVLSGTSAVDESLITGESMPVVKKAGDSVTGGTINGTGALEYRAEKVGLATLLAQIIEMVKRAQGAKAPIQRLADVVSGWFVPVVMIIATLAFVGWLVALQGSENAFVYALTAFVSVLVIACPCALGLATPTAIMVGTGRGAENGILFKGGESLEKAHQVNVIVFDKTGTLTQGKPQVVDFKILNDHYLSYLPFVYAAEKFSEHPLASAIVAYRVAYSAPSGTSEMSANLPNPLNFESLTGLGVKAKFDDKTIVVGSPKLAKGLSNSFENEIQEWSNQGKTVVVAGVEGKEVFAVFAISDPIKETSAAAVAHLHTLGIQTWMITGDNSMTAASVAKQVGISHFMAEVLPGQKAAKIQELQSKGFIVAMVGDGVNDAPALAQAHIGIAMGTGTDIAMEAADITLVRGDLRLVSKALELSRATMKTIKQNLFLSFIYNMIGIPMAAGLLYPLTGAFLSPIWASLAMALSSVSVVLNSLRLRSRVF